MSKSQIYKQSQTQLQDQALSFDNLMKLVSTLEQMAIKVEGIQKQKQFKSHDFYNYNWKDLEALKQQATVQMYSFATSKFIFDSQYGKGVYKFKNNFSKDDLYLNLTNYEATFKKTNMEEALQMIEDLKEILDGDISKFFMKIEDRLANGKKLTPEKPNIQNFVFKLQKTSKYTQSLLDSIDAKQWQESPQKPIHTQQTIINSQPSQPQFLPISKQNPTHVQQKISISKQKKSTIKSRCSKILLQLLEHPSAKYFKKKQTFLKTGVGKRLIDQSIDLDQVNYKVNKQIYRNYQEFLNDVERIWRTVDQHLDLLVNSYRNLHGSNSKSNHESSYYKQSRTLKQKFERMVKRSSIISRSP